MISHNINDGAELVSALADDQLQEQALVQALDLMARTPDARELWRDIHLVRDLLNDPACAVDALREAAFMQRLRQQLVQDASQVHFSPEAAEPEPDAPRMSTFEPASAANDSVLSWPRWAGLASVGIAALLGWQWIQLPVHPGASGALAQSVAPVDVAAPSEVAVMVRDPRLDQLLAAHQRLGGASALQSPAGFLRSATFERPTR